MSNAYGINDVYMAPINLVRTDGTCLLRPASIIRSSV